MKNKYINKVVNLGCRLNSYESSIIEQVLEENKSENITVINTCSVTNQALKKSVQAVKRSAKLNPKNKIFITGCASEINPVIFKNTKLVHRIIPNQEKTNKDFYKTCQMPKNFENLSIKFNFPQPRKKLSSHTRALLQIQQGCDHSCTFCVIPSGRGRSVSLPLGGIMNSINKYLSWDYKEIVLTGVDITSYGNDLPGKPKLGNVIKRIFKLQPNLKRLRLSSLDPAEIDEDLLSLIKFDYRILPHIHFSAQSGDDLILKRMKRRHNNSQLLELCENIKTARPSLTFGADLIVGFPTETHKNFTNTCQLVKSGFFSNIHIFPYSPMKKTPASKMPQVCSKTILERTKNLRELANFYQNKLMQNKVNEITKILFENEKLSYTNDYFKVNLQKVKNKITFEELRGKIVKIKLSGIKENIFKGEII